jgi:hypothetical protein
VNNYLGFNGYISTPTLINTLASTVTGLGTAGYASTQTLDLALQSSFNSFISYPYISSASLTSTIQGLGTFGYISTQSLVSSVSSLYLLISAGLSTVSLRSSIAYAGCNGTLDAVVDGADLMFSTAYINLGAFSTYIVPTSRITLDINETIVFASITGPAFIGTISSVITCDSFYMPNTNINEAFVYQFDSYSNVYSKNLTFPLDTNFVRTSYTSTLALFHRLPNGYYLSEVNIQGFQDCNITIGNSTRNSIFVTILN